MFRNSYQRGMLTVFFSCGAHPFSIWDTVINNGYINRFLDPDIKSLVYEIGGTNVSTTYMICPKGNNVLGITMPFLVMIVKNLKKYFSFEVTALDDTGTRRRFRISNFQNTTQILPLCTVMPIGLSDGWNQIQFNVAEFMRRAYQKKLVEVQKLKINANIRLRRIYFTERLLPEDELPAEYKLFFPLSKTGKRNLKNKDNVPSTSEPAVEAVIENKNKNTSSTLLKPVIVKSATSMKEMDINILLPPLMEDKPAEQQDKATSEVATENGDATNTAIESSTVSEIRDDMEHFEDPADAGIEVQIETQAKTAVEGQTETHVEDTTEIQDETNAEAVAEVQADTGVTTEALTEETAPDETADEMPNV